MTPHPAALWAARTPLPPHHVDCVTAIMLKILDGKCKMAPQEKAALAAVYQVVKDQPGERLEASLHPLIARALAAPEPALLEIIYEQRVLAETRISRPVMKGFKAWLREEGVIGGDAA